MGTAGSRQTGSAGTPWRNARVLAGVLIAAVLVVSVTPPAAADLPADSQDASADTYIVALHPGADVRGLLGDHGIPGESVTAEYRMVLNGFAARISGEAAAGLAADPRVAHVKPDRRMQMATTQTSPPWGLDRSGQRHLPLSETYAYGTTGTGVAAYIVDTGVRATHDDFGGRVVAGYNATNYQQSNESECALPLSPASADDDHGHGTHVAGTVGGATYGIAKAVTVVPVKVLDCQGLGWMSDLIEGIDWVVAHHTEGAPAVANMSLGLWDPYGTQSAFDDVVKDAVADGITFVVAAGNEGEKACDYTPARVSEALTVGASDDADYRPAWSNYGKCLDLFAAGTSILSAGHLLDGSEMTTSGTSTAAPHVAGAAARYLQSRPSASPATVTRALLADTTRDVISAAGYESPNRLLYAGPRATSLSIATSAHRVTYGTSVTVKGRLVTPDGLGVPSRTVTLQRRLAGTTKWRSFEALATSGTGRVSDSHEPARTFAYRLVHGSSADYEYSRSTALTIGVRTRVTAKLSSTTVDPGEKAFIRGVVRPSHAGHGVILQRYRGGAWREVATTNLNKRSRYRFRLPTANSGKLAFRVVKPPDVDHLRGVSPRRLLTVG